MRGLPRTRGQATLVHVLLPALTVIAGIALFIWLHPKPWTDESAAESATARKGPPGRLVPPAATDQPEGSTPRAATGSSDSASSTGGAPLAKKALNPLRSPTRAKRSEGRPARPSPVTPGSASNAQGPRTASRFGSPTGVSSREPHGRTDSATAVRSPGRPSATETGAASATGRAAARSTGGADYAAATAGDGIRWSGRGPGEPAADEAPAEEPTDQTGDAEPAPAPEEEPDGDEDGDEEPDEGDEDDADEEPEDEPEDEPDLRLGEARIALPTEPVPANESFLVPVTINLGENVLGAYSVCLEYDPTVLQCDAVTPGSSSLGEPFVIRINPEAKNVFFSDINLSDRSVTGVQMVAQVKFTAIGNSGASCRVAGVLRNLADATASIPPKPVGGPTPRSLTGRGIVKIQ